MTPKQRKALSFCWGAAVVALALSIWYYDFQVITVLGTGTSAALIPLAYATHVATKREEFRRLAIAAACAFAISMVTIALIGIPWVWLLPTSLSLASVATVPVFAFDARRLLQSGDASSIPRMSRGRRAIGEVLCLVVGAAGMAWPLLETRSTSDSLWAARRVAGCYRVHVGPIVPRELRDEQERGVLPPVIRLDTTKSTGRHADFVTEFDQRMIWPGWRNGVATWRAQLLTTYWVWHDGLHGAGVALNKVGPFLFGRAIVLTDATPGYPVPTPRTFVFAAPTYCGNVPNDTARVGFGVP